MKIFKKKAKNLQEVPYILNLRAYMSKDGSFSYERYLKIQERGNKDKISHVWVREENIKYISNYLQEKINRPKFGLCHGTRRGLEQAWFIKYLGCNVIGTEISETAVNFANTIKWDFHEVKEEWIGNVDFIYSNSFDHAYDPERCLNNWMKCLNSNGLCIIEHSNLHSANAVDDLDPFGADLMIMPYLVLEWSKGTYAVVDILDAPNRGSLRFLNFLVLKKLC